MSDNNKEICFSEDALALVQRIMKRYPEGKQKSAILPILHIAQLRNRMGTRADCQSWQWKTSGTPRILEASITARE